MPAKFGLTGGKLRCEIGVALGIGAKVSFDLDVNGAVSAVKNATSYVVDNATAIKQVAGILGNEISAGAKQTWNEVSDVAKQAWDDVSAGAKQAWNEVSDVAKQAWKLLTTW